MKSTTEAPYRGPPPYLLRITSKVNPKHRTIAGAVFPVRFGQFNLVLNPGVRLDWTDDVCLSLVPTKEAERSEQVMEHPGDSGELPDGEPRRRGKDDEFPF
jgi:hypothetical protein